MYSKEETKELRKLFWTSFGKYMKKYDEEYTKIRWVNYRTGIRDMYFRLECTKKEAWFSIDFQHRDAGIRELFFEQLEQLKSVLESTLEKKMVWDKVYYDTYEKEVSRVWISIEGVSIFNKDNWKEVFLFFESCMVPTHNFWLDFKELFKQLDD